MFDMPTHTNEKIIVSFDAIEKEEQMNLENFKFCTVCKQLRDIEQYESRFIKRQYNKICRKCLNKTAKLKKDWYYNKKTKKIFKKPF